MGTGDVFYRDGGGSEFLGYHFSGDADVDADAYHQVVDVAEFGAHFGQDAYEFAVIQQRRWAI